MIFTYLYYRILFVYWILPDTFLPVSVCSIINSCLNIVCQSVTEVFIDKVDDFPAFIIQIDQVQFFYRMLRWSFISCFFPFDEIPWIFTIWAQVMLVLFCKGRSMWVTQLYAGCPHLLCNSWLLFQSMSGEHWLHHPSASLAAKTRLTPSLSSSPWLRLFSCSLSPVLPPSSNWCDWHIPL